MREMVVVSLGNSALVTSSGSTGSYVDLQGYVNPGGREIKFVLAAAVGTTAGTCGGSIQSAADTAGTGVATVLTFTTLTSAGGITTSHGVVPAAHRYVRFLGTAQTGKSMRLQALVVAQARVSP
jgi:hypothetical protein